MIKVLIVEDSPVEREFLSHIINQDLELEVVGAVTSGEEALKNILILRPDVITMDIHMPGISGFEATKRIIEIYPVPIIIVSGSYDYKDTYKSFRAIEAGALAVVQKPRGTWHIEHQRDVNELIKYIKLMSEIKVVRRFRHLKRRNKDEEKLKITIEHKNIKIVALGASTGGPAVVREIFGALPKPWPTPIAVVQHMSPGFMENFVRWLSLDSGIICETAVHGQVMLPGKAYFAPDDYHMHIYKDFKISLFKGEKENGIRPSISQLFDSVATEFGKHAIGVLLTGMGSDGAAALKRLRDAGATTVVQDEESSIVFGMPKEAIEIGAAEYILQPKEMVSYLSEMVVGV